MNWLFAKKEGGTFILRIDDTDLERSTNDYENGIREDLTWLGLEWQETFNQSHRFPMYEAAASKLKEAGLLYPCYETAEELDRQRKLQRVQGKPPVYNRGALELAEADKEKLEAEGRKPHWRFKLSGNPVTWHDVVRGEQTIDTASISDPVLIRADGSFLYTLPSVVDDIEAKITHVIRGEDHVTNSGAQIEVFRALSDHLPSFAHTPLLVGSDGKGLSKRLGSLSMDQLRERFIEPLAICSLLGKIGTSDPIEARPSLDVLVEEFSFDKIGRAPARFDEDELLLVNGRLLHETDYDTVRDHLEEMGVAGGETLWMAIRGNVETLSDAAAWSTTVYAPAPGIIDDEDKDFCATAAKLLPAEVDGDTWGPWLAAVKEATGRKGKGLFMPLRRALTGRDHGPEMGPLLALMGADKARLRLQGETG
jgi:glutamyl-tRNA synthetase